MALLMGSEERGTLSYVRNGRIIQDISNDEAKVLLQKYFEAE